MPICFQRLGRQNFILLPHQPVPLKGPVCPSGPCPIWAGAPAFSLCWSCLEHVHAAEPASVCFFFPLSKINRTVYGPIKNTVVLKIVLNFLGNNFHLSFFTIWEFPPHPTKTSSFIPKQLRKSSFLTQKHNLLTLIVSQMSPPGTCMKQAISGLFSQPFFASQRVLVHENINCQFSGWQQKLWFLLLLCCSATNSC